MYSFFFPSDPHRAQIFIYMRCGCVHNTLRQIHTFSTSRVSSHKFLLPDMRRQFQEPKAVDFREG